MHRWHWHADVFYWPSIYKTIYLDRLNRFPAGRLGRSDSENLPCCQRTIALMWFDPKYGRARSLIESYWHWVRFCLIGAILKREHSASLIMKDNRIEWHKITLQAQQWHCKRHYNNWIDPIRILNIVECLRSHGDKCFQTQIWDCVPLSIHYSEQLRCDCTHQQPILNDRIASFRFQNKQTYNSAPVASSSQPVTTQKSMTIMVTDKIHGLCIRLWLACLPVLVQYGIFSSHTLYAVSGTVRILCHEFTILSDTAGCSYMNRGVNLTLSLACLA